MDSALSDLIAESAARREMWLNTPRLVPVLDPSKITAAMREWINESYARYAASLWGGSVSDSYRKQVAPFIAKVCAGAQGSPTEEIADYLRHFGALADEPRTNRQLIAMGHEQMLRRGWTPLLVRASA